MKGLVIVSVLCLALGLGVIFGFCNGTTGFQFAYPLSGCSIHVDITTTGAAVAGAVGLTLAGTFLLVVAWIIAVIGMFGRGETVALKRREEPFAE